MLDTYAHEKLRYGEHDSDADARQPSESPPAHSDSVGAHDVEPAALYVPGAHALHRVALLADAYVPGSHGVHAAAPDELKVPALHATPATAPAGQRYPAAHTLHDDDAGRLYCPAGHDCGVTVPSGHAVPPGHAPLHSSESSPAIAPY